MSLVGLLEPFGVVPGEEPLDYIRTAIICTKSKFITAGLLGIDEYAIGVG